MNVKEKKRGGKGCLKRWMNESSDRKKKWGRLEISTDIWPLIFASSPAATFSDNEHDAPPQLFNLILVSSAPDQKRHSSAAWPPSTPIHPNDYHSFTPFCWSLLKRVRDIKLPSRVTGPNLNGPNLCSGVHSLGAFASSPSFAVDYLHD